jgi:hypothetical protein
MDEHLYRLFLAHAVGSGDTLFQHRGIPWKIDVDHRVRRLQIQSRRAGVRREEQPAAGLL